MMVIIKGITADGKQRPDPYSLLWIFTCGSIIGFILETVYCFSLNGYLENRQGMIYGPFSQLYGFAAVLLHLLFAPRSAESEGTLFVKGVLFGGIYEFASSWLQEQLFGTISWEYRYHFLSLGGRTSLLYMFFWGILTVVYIKLLYPWLLRLINSIPRRHGAYLAGVIAFSLTLNMLISSLAVTRWTNRRLNLPPRNNVELYLDKYYPDETLEAVYPTMKLVR